MVGHGPLEALCRPWQYLLVTWAQKRFIGLTFFGNCEILAKTILQYSEPLHYGAFVNLASPLREKKIISKVPDILRAKTDKNVFKLIF